MTAHARLKNEFAEDKMYHNLMTLLIWFLSELFQFHPPVCLDQLEMSEIISKDFEFTDPVLNVSGHEMERLKGNI